MNLKPKRDDLRTRYGRETEVLRQVAQHNGFSVFWACETQTRAHAIKRLGERGAIERVEGGGYPWCPYRITVYK